MSACGPPGRGVTFFSPDARPRSEVVSLPALRGSSFINGPTHPGVDHAGEAPDVKSGRITGSRSYHTALEMYWSRPIPTVSITAKTSVPVAMHGAPPAVAVGRQGPGLVPSASV